jgi:hypothetical protein
MTSEAVFELVSTDTDDYAHIKTPINIPWNCRRVRYWVDSINTVSNFLSTTKEDYITVGIEKVEQKEEYTVPKNQYGSTDITDAVEQWIFSDAEMNDDGNLVGELFIKQAYEFWYPFNFQTAINIVYSFDWEYERNDKTISFSARVKWDLQQAKWTVEFTEDEDKDLWEISEFRIDTDELYLELSPVDPDLEIKENESGNAVYMFATTEQKERKYSVSQKGYILFDDRCECNERDLDKTLTLAANELTLDDLQAPKNLNLKCEYNADKCLLFKLKDQSGKEYKFRFEDIGYGLTGTNAM